MAKKPVEKRKMPVRMDMLSADERAALDKEAQASIASELAQDARDAYFAQKLEALRREQVPEDQLGHVTIDAAPYVPCIMIDGVQFFHGYTYEVPMKQAAVLYEQMQRSWHHQDEIDGRGRTEAYRRPSHVTLNRRHAGSATRGANGTVVADI